MMLSNTNALVIGWSITAILYFTRGSIKAMGIDIPNWVIGAFGVLGLLYVFINVVFFRKSTNEKNDAVDPKKAITQSLLDDTYSLYNNTGLFIQSCYNDSVKISGGKRMDLDKEFKNYLKVFKGKMIDFPQELEPKITRFYNSLLDYIKRGESIISLPKTREYYSKQQKLAQDFSEDAPVLYSKLEVELRKLLNKK